MIILLVTLLLFPIINEAQWESKLIKEGTALTSIMEHNGKIWIGGVDGQIFTANSYEDDWTYIQTPSTQSIIKIEFVDDDIAFALGARNSLLKSVDGGNSWNSIDYDFGTGVNAGFRDMKFFNSEIGFILTAESLLRTFDSGNSWERIIFKGYDEYDDLYKLIFFNEMESYILGGTIHVPEGEPDEPPMPIIANYAFYSTNDQWDSRSWPTYNFIGEPHPDPLDPRIVEANFFSKEVGYIGTSEGAVRFTSDGYNYKTILNVGDFIEVRSFDFSIKGVGIVSFNHNKEIYLTKDNGDNWELFNLGIYFNDVIVYGEESFFGVAYDGRLYTYSLITNEAPVAEAGFDTTIILGETLKLDGSESYDPDEDEITYLWTITSAPDGSVVELQDESSASPSLTPDLAGEYTVSLVVNDGTVDSEPDEAVITVQEPEEAVDDLIQVVIDLDLPKGTENSLTSTLDNVQKSLEKDNTGAAVNQLEAFINKVEAQRGKDIPEEEADMLIADTERIIEAIENGLYKRGYVGENTIEDVIATEYSLRQNYPNPFNPTTMISYSIPNDGYVELSIYDVLGNEVAKIANGYKSAGHYSYTFDASKLTSGIYFYTIKSGAFTATNKMLLMK